MATKNFNKGDQVQILIGNTTFTGKFSHMAPNGKAYIHVNIDGNLKGYERSIDKVWKIGEATTSFDFSEAGKKAVPQGKNFDVNQRFDFLSSLIKMVIKNIRVSLVITGEGGLGKTFTVREELEKAGLVEDEHYKFVKGFTTAKGLYNTLYDHNDKLIIFDDCDDALKNEISKNILKGALDSYDKRIISWMSQAIASDYPTEFEFTGRIIFISNMSQKQIDKAVLSRSSKVDLTMSTDDKLVRMEKILHSKKFKPEVPKEQKEEAFAVIKKHAHSCYNLNLRSLIEIVDYRISGEENWEDLSEYVLYDAS